MSETSLPRVKKPALICGTDEARMYQNTLDYSEKPDYLPGEEKVFSHQQQFEFDTSHGHGLQFYKKHVYFMFDMYMDGSLTLEEFVHYRSWPQLAIRELGLEKLIAATEKLAISPKVEDSNNVRKSVEKLKKKPRDLKTTLHKEFLKNIIEKIERSRRKGTVLLSDIKGQETKQRLLKLRKFMLEKMKDRKKSIHNESTIDSFKLFNVIMNVANETIRKLENKNMIDSFNLDHFKAEIQKSPIYLSDMNIRMKAFGAKSCQTYSEREAEKVHLKRFLRDMDNKSSTHAQLVISVFNQIVDRYYKHLRPPTPPKVKELGEIQARQKGLQVEKESSRNLQAQAEFFRKKSGSSDQIEDRLSRNLKNNSMKIEPIYEKQFDGSPRTLRDVPIAAKFFQSRATSKEINQTSKAGLFNSSPQDTSQQSDVQFRGPQRPTFVSTLRRRVDNRDIIEYRYDREKRLLQYLKLDGRPYRDQRRLLDQKIDLLVQSHKQIDEDRDNLLDKINNFNPLDLEDLKRYINHTKGYAVVFCKRSTI